MGLQEKQLGQLRPADAVAASLYSIGVTVTSGIVKTIIVCNVNSAATALYRIFADDDGTTYDETTALFYDISLGPNKSDQIDTFYAMSNSDGNLAVRTDTGNILTFTVFGVEVT